MKLLTSVFVLTWYVVIGTFDWESCPRVTVQADFNITRYLGTWYELVRNEDMRYEKGECDRANYSLNSDGTIKVVNSEFRDGEWTSVEGYAYCHSWNPAKCHVSFSMFAPDGDYKIISTDYENYALVFSCFDLAFAHWKWAWVLARNISLDVSPFISQIESFGIPASGLHYTQQNNCP